MGSMMRTPGFCIEVCDHPVDFFLNEEKYDLTIRGADKKIAILKRSNGKYPDCSFVKREGQYVVGFEGYWVNSSEFEGDSLSERLLFAFAKYGDYLNHHIRGSFQAFFWNVQAEELHVFTDFCAVWPSFYWHGAGKMLFSSHMEDISDRLQYWGVRPAMNKQALYSMLCFGAMIENDTILDGVHRLHFGELLHVSHGEPTIVRHYQVEGAEYSEAEMNEVIERVHHYLSRANKENLEFDRLRNRKPLGTLSGGLDSRFVTLQPSKKDRLRDVLCFASEGSLDHRIAKQIADEEDLNFWFVALNGYYMNQIDRNMGLFQGQMYYVTSAHFDFAMRSIPLEDFGLIHMGLFGDGRMGDQVLSSEILETVPFQRFAWDTQILDKLTTRLSEVEKRYNNVEKYLFTNFTLNLYCSGAWAAIPRTYAVSPFSDPDFVKYSFTIHPKLKNDHRMYIHFLNKYYKPMTKYRWEATRMRPDAVWKKSMGVWMNRFRKVGRMISGRPARGMTPMQYWYDRDENISLQLDDEIREGLARIPSGSLREDLQGYLSRADIKNRLALITVFRSIEKYNLCLDEI